jgi:hypothetical protein
MALDQQQLAFKGIRLSEVIGLSGVYEQTLAGLYVGPSDGTSAAETLVETGMDGGLLDPQAAGVPIVALGLERDGYRGGRLAFCRQHGSRGSHRGRQHQLGWGLCRQRCECASASPWPWTL